MILLAQPRKARQQGLTGGRPRDRRNDPGPVVVYVVVFHKLLVRQDDGHDAGVVAIETGREDHAVEKKSRKAVVLR